MILAFDAACLLSVVLSDFFRWVQRKYGWTSTGRRSWK